MKEINVLLKAESNALIHTVSRVHISSKTVLPNALLAFL